MSMEEKQNFQTFQDFNQSIFKPETREEISEVIKNCYKKNIPLEIIEVQSGEYLGEDDIERIEDNYGRKIKND